MAVLNQILLYPLFEFSGKVITVGQISYVVLLFLLGILTIRWVGAFLRSSLARRRVNPDLIQMVSRAWLVLGIIVLITIAMDLLNIPLTAFAFISGAVAIGLGFGAQNIINNFISGWILMWERPIRIGDFLEIGDMRGTVEMINTRFTRIRRVDGVHMLVPNSFLLENTLINWTLVDSVARTSVRVGVAYGSDTPLVAKLLMQAAQEHADVLKEPESAVLFDDFSDNSLTFELAVWALANAERGLRVLRSDLRFRIDELFREHDIIIAFPQRDIHVDGELLVQQVGPQTFGPQTELTV
jgi:small-conductance mechanosensitive channel